MNHDKLMIGGHEFHSRFILGSGKYSLKLIEAAVKDAGAEMITLAVRRANTKEQENILDFIPKGVTLLPNTSGARTAEEAVRIARLARELGCGNFVKIEIMRDSKYLLPDNQETIKATEILAKEGFVVMPYMYPDLNIARDLVNAGAAAITPFSASEVVSSEVSSITQTGAWAPISRVRMPSRLPTVFSISAHLLPAALSGRLFSPLRLRRAVVDHEVTGVHAVDERLCNQRRKPCLGRGAVGHFA